MPWLVYNPTTNIVMRLAYSGSITPGANEDVKWTNDEPPGTIWLHIEHPDDRKNEPILATCEDGLTAKAATQAQIVAAGLETTPVPANKRRLRQKAKDLATQSQDLLMQDFMAEMVTYLS